MLNDNYREGVVPSYPRTEGLKLWQRSAAALVAVGSLTIGLTSCGREAEPPQEPAATATPIDQESPSPNEAETGQVLDASVEPFDEITTTELEQDADTRQEVYQRLNGLSGLKQNSFNRLAAHSKANVDTLKEYLPDREETIDEFDRMQLIFGTVTPEGISTYHNQLSAESKLYGNEQDWPDQDFAQKYFGNRLSFTQEELSDTLAHGSATDLARLIESTLPNRQAVTDLGIDMIEAHMEGDETAMQNYITLVKQGTAPYSDMQSTYVEDSKFNLSIYQTFRDEGSLDELRLSPNPDDDHIVNAFVHSNAYLTFDPTVPEDLFDKQGSPTIPGFPIVNMLVTRHFNSHDLGENGQLDPDDAVMTGGYTYLASYLIAGLGNGELTALMISRTELEGHGDFFHDAAWDLPYNNTNSEPEVNWQ